MTNDNRQVTGSSSCDSKKNMYDQRLQDFAPSQKEVWVVKSTRRHTIWWILGILAVAIISILAINIVASLHSLNHTVNQNYTALTTQSSQLSSIQAKLNLIMLQISQLQQEIQLFFSNLIHAIQAK